MYSIRPSASIEFGSKVCMGHSSASAYRFLLKGAGVVYRMVYYGLFLCTLSHSYVTVCALSFPRAAAALLNLQNVGKRVS